MSYRYEAQSAVAFVQQLASNMLSRGYYFYVIGHIPDRKDPAAVDAKLIAKYGIDVSRQCRTRRKTAGLANVHYLRHERFFILLATHGTHSFFAEEAERIRDARKQPIRFQGYSLTVKQGGFLKKSDEDDSPCPDNKLRVRVQIAREPFRDLKAYFLDTATRRSVEQLSKELYCVPYEPYAPIRKQLLNLLRMINVKRGAAGLEKLPPTVLRYQRDLQKVFVHNGEVHREGVCQVAKVA